MGNSTLVHTINPERVKELMALLGLDVPGLAAAAEITPKTLYTLLAGYPVSLSTAGRVYRALGPGNREGFFAGSSTELTAEPVAAA